MMDIRLASLMLFLTQNVESSQIAAVDMCLDHKGVMVKPGERYFPLGTDPCTQCTCLNGKPEMCISVFCSPPENCRQYHPVNDKCCEFVCLEGDLVQPNGVKQWNNTLFIKPNDNRSSPGSITTNNLGLRLIASTITSFLILALLLFMIHRLRQRRLLLMIRRLQTRRLEQVNALPGENGSGFGYFPGHDHYDFGGSFNEPPPPYTFWKPPEHYIPPGEAPPPYEDSFGVTILPCFEINREANTNNTRDSSTLTNSVATSPTPLPLPLTLPQNPTIAMTVTQTRDGHTQLQIPQRQTVTPQNITLTNVSTSPLSPIIDTISSDQCYEHITVVRINGNSTITNLASSNNSDTNSTSSSSALSSPSNCSASTSSTSTQSTVRLQDCSDSISRL